MGEPLNFHYPARGICAYKEEGDGEIVCGGVGVGGGGWVCIVLVESNFLW